MPHLDVPGASLYYETEGEISSPPLLLIHAGIATLRMWDAQLPAFAADHFVVRYDTRGFGQTTTENVEYSDRADALALLDHLGLPRATIIGCSRGGAIGIDLAIEHPSRVAGLVTIGSGPSGFPELELTDGEDAAYDALDAAFEAQDWDEMLRLDTKLWAIGPARDEASLDPQFVRTVYELNRVNSVHAAECPISLPLEPPAYDRVVDITCPTLVTVGQYDLTAALVECEYLATAIPDAASAVFPDAAHLPSVERPEEFERVVLGWLREKGL